MMVIELGDLILRINPKVIDVFTSFIQDDEDKPESGGILMGYYIDDYSFYVTDLSVPSERDSSSRFTFIRSFINAQKFIKSLFINSKGKKIYLGEWHTHPEKIPTPSFTDLKSFEDQLNKNQLNSKFIFMIILGTNGLYVANYSKEGLLSQKQISINFTKSNLIVN